MKTTSMMEPATVFLLPQTLSTSGRIPQLLLLPINASFAWGTAGRMSALQSTLVLYRASNNAGPYKRLKLQYTRTPIRVKQKTKMKGRDCLHCLPADLAKVFVEHIWPFFVAEEVLHRIILYFGGKSLFGSQAGNLNLGSCSITWNIHLRCSDSRPSIRSITS